MLGDDSKKNLLENNFRVKTASYHYFPNTSRSLFSCLYTNIVFGNEQYIVICNHIYLHFIQFSSSYRFCYSVILYVPIRLLTVY